MEPLYLGIQRKMSSKNPKVKVLKTIQNVVSTALPHFHQCGIRLPLSLSPDPSMATLWCSFRSEQDWAEVNQAKLVLTEFPAVVVSIKLEFYVNWRGWDRHMVLLGCRGM